MTAHPSRSCQQPTGKMRRVLPSLWQHQPLLPGSEGLMPLRIEGEADYPNGPIIWKGNCESGSPPATVPSLQGEKAGCAKQPPAT